jgi:hypothetical protein
MTDLTKIERHPGADYILYAKGHYERFSDDGNLWSDLLKIQAAYCGSSVEYLTKWDALSTLIRLIELSPKIKLWEFLVDIAPQNDWRIWKDKTDLDGKINWDYETAVASKCLSILHFLAVYKDGETILEIGEADPKVLPLHVIT